MSYTDFYIFYSIQNFSKYKIDNVSFAYRYNPHCANREMSTKDILREKIGVCRQYVKIFSEMCMIAGISVKNIRGFSKAYTYLPGMFTCELPKDQPCNAGSAFIS